MIEGVARILLGLVLSATLAVSPAATPLAPQVTCVPSVEGTVTAIDLSHDMMILQLDSGTLTVQMQPRTVLNVPESDNVTAEQAEFSAIRVGDRVSVQGVCLDHRTLLALRLTVGPEVVAPPAGPEQAAETIGAVGGPAAPLTVEVPTLIAQTLTTTVSAPSPAAPAPPSAVTLPPPTGGVPLNQPSTGAVEEASGKSGWGYGDTDHTHSGPPGKIATGTELEASAKPGWGYGDKNHTHSGPSGKIEAGAESETRAKPGWGYGDKNHTHSGPPGQTEII